MSLQQNPGETGQQPIIIIQDQLVGHPADPLTTALSNEAAIITGDEIFYTEEMAQEAQTEPTIPHDLFPTDPAELAREELGGMFLGTRTEYHQGVSTGIAQNWASLDRPIRGKEEGITYQTEHLRHRREITDIVNGKDNRMAMIVGPCSIESIQTARQYLEQMAELQNTVGDQIKLVIRLYGSKPRTTAFKADGTQNYAGYLAHRDNHQNPVTKILDAQAVLEFRELYDYATELGLATATEFLSVEEMEHLADRPDFIAVGARTVGEKKYLSLARDLGQLGLETVFGFKNALDGELDPALDAIQQVSNENQNCTYILRGGQNGKISQPNWENNNFYQMQLTEGNNGYQRTIKGCVDACHSNSGKDLNETISILLAIEQMILTNGATFPKLVMLESHLTRQHSVTDPCLGYEETAIYLTALAKALRGKYGKQAQCLN